MTTDKPDVLIWDVADPELHGDVMVVRLEDYEALQAECEKLREHLQNLIDQTTPLEPVPGNPMWSRRIQLDEVIAERDSLRAECEKLVQALMACAKANSAAEVGLIVDDALAAHRKQGGE